MTQDWTTFRTEAGGFYTGHLERPRTLFRAFAVQQTGSGRPAGPRQLYWQTVAVFAYAALEAGLEDLVFAAHALRNGCEGTPSAPGANTPRSNPRKWLVEDRIQNPNAQRIDTVLFQDFGLMLDQLPAQALLEVRYKDWAKGGSGKGAARPGPSSWHELRAFVDALAYIRNATAHGDASKLHVGSPTKCEGSLWVTCDDGTWSVQQPHALTALRVVLSVFNLVAVALGDHLGVDARQVVTSPSQLGYPT